MADGDEEQPRSPNGGKPRGLALEGRNGEIYRAVAIYQKTREAVAEEYGISRQRVDQIVEKVRKELPAHDLDEMREETLELYREMNRRTLEMVDLIPAPVFVGKDGDIALDERGQVVRDYSGRMKAIELALKITEQRRKLMGLDAAQKSEVGGSVKFEIVGVNTDDLT
jgi:hypothetical protein